MTSILNPVWVLALSSIGWGLTWLPLQYFESQGLNGPALVWLTFFSASLVLLPFVLKQPRPSSQDWKPLLMIVIFGGLANLLFQVSMFYGDVVRVMILFYLLPVWSVLGGRMILGEKLDWIRGLTLLLALLGGTLILGGVSVWQGAISWIDIMAIGSGFAFAMNNIAFRSADEVPLVTKVTAMFLGVVIFAGVYSLSVPNVVWPSDAKLIGLAVAYGVLGVLIISLATQWGVTQMGAGRASIIIVTELVVAVLSAVIILQRDFSLIEGFGAMLVVSAAIIEGFREDAES